MLLSLGNLKYFLSAFISFSNVVIIEKILVKFHLINSFYFLWIGVPNGLQISHIFYSLKERNANVSETGQKQSKSQSKVTEFCTTGSSLDLTSLD